MTSTLTFTIPKALWLTANRPAQNMGFRSAKVRQLHDLARETATAATLWPIDGQVHVSWTVRYPKGVRHDKGEASNAQPTTKALLDGLVPHWLPDDGPRFVVAETFRRGPNLDRPSDHEIELVLTPQEVPF